MKKYTVILTQREVDALWLISWRIGGDSTKTYRGVFSDGHVPSDDNIHSKFREIKSDGIKTDVDIAGAVEFKVL